MSLMILVIFNLTGSKYNSRVTEVATCRLVSQPDFKWQTWLNGRQGLDHRLVWWAERWAGLWYQFIGHVPPSLENYFPDCVSWKILLQRCGHWLVAVCPICRAIPTIPGYYSGTPIRRRCSNQVWMSCWTKLCCSIAYECRPRRLILLIVDQRWLPESFRSWRT